MRCLGEGSPVIILESGTDGSGLEEYALLMEPLAERTMTMTCTYDRPGAGQSDPPSERRRTLDDTVADLHDLVEAAGLAAPFVLVGSSGGGGIAVYYAGRYPEDVAGLVMLDPAHPTGDLGKEFPGAMGWRNPEHLDYVDADQRLFRHPPNLGDIPLRIVTATGGQSNAKAQSFWLDISSRAEQTTIEGGHDLSSENPDGVVAEVESLLGAIEG
jgi:pimeloyl-ACP methyl ester carboxylesterase